MWSYTSTLPYSCIACRGTTSLLHLYTQKKLQWLLNELASWVFLIFFFIKHVLSRKEILYKNNFMTWDSVHLQGHLSVTLLEMVLKVEANFMIWTPVNVSPQPLLVPNSNSTFALRSSIFSAGGHFVVKFLLESGGSGCSCCGW